MSKKKKVRADFRKNRSARARTDDWTRQFDKHRFADKDMRQMQTCYRAGSSAPSRT